MMDQEKPSRRSFLKGLFGAGATLGLAAALPSTASAEAPPPAPEAAPPAEAAKTPKDTMMEYAASVLNPSNLPPQGQELRPNSESINGITRHSISYRTAEGTPIVVNYNTSDSDSTPLLIGATRIEETVPDPDSQITDDKVLASIESSFTPLPPEAAAANINTPKIPERGDSVIKEKVWENPGGTKDARGVMIVKSPKGTQAWVTAAKMFPGSIQHQRGSAFVPTPR